MPNGENQHHEAHNDRSRNQAGGRSYNRRDSGSRGKREGGYRSERQGSGNRGNGGKRDFKRNDSRGGYGKPGGSRPSRNNLGRKPFDNEDANGERKPYQGDRDRKPYGDGNRKPYSKDSRGGKSFGGGRKPYGDNRDRKPYGNRDSKPYGDRGGKPYGDKPRSADRFARDDRRGNDRNRNDNRTRDFKRADDQRENRSFDEHRDAQRSAEEAQAVAGAAVEHAVDSRDERGFKGERAERPGFERRGPWRPNAENAELAERHPQQEGVYRGELELDENGDYKYRNRPRRENPDKRRGAKRSFGNAPRTSGVTHRDSAHTASPARMAALEVCRIVRERDAFAQDLIHKRIDSSRMSREDRAFATRLVLGVVSSTGTLDDVINRCLDRVSDINDDVRDAMRISTYEIVFLEKEPHAAVSQGVDLVRSVAPKAAGLANAVLRRIADKKHKFPFGDPRTDFAAFARLHAFPEWLAKLALKDLGPELVRDYLTASNEPAPLFIALNPVKANEEEVLTVIRESHGDPVEVVMSGEAIPGCYCLSEGRVLFDGRVRHLLAQGMLLVSDASSQQVARLVLPEEKPKSFLEIGAGRGTKTILIQGNAQRKWGSQIEDYVTLDNLGFKTELTAERAGTYGVNVAESLTGDATDLDAVVGDRTFDSIFIDAPCSGLGTLRRHPEIRWRLAPERIEEFAKTGLAMLTSAASHVKEGGELVFATCTITRAENIDVVKAFLASEAGSAFRLAPMGTSPCFNPALKPGGPDAHFAVKLLKSAQAE